MLANTLPVLLRTDFGSALPLWSGILFCINYPADFRIDPYFPEWWQSKLEYACPSKWKVNVIQKESRWKI